MRKLLLVAIFAVFLIAACKDQVACTQQAKICPDGTAVGRTGPNCEFAECPAVNDETAAGCNYDGQIKKYVGKSADECERIRFMCEPNSEYFADECGCGCMAKNNLTGHFCTEEEKNAEACIEIYKPVCGWFDPKIQCIKYPCAQTFSNSCFACSDEKVISWTEGKCPK